MSHVREQIAFNEIMRETKHLTLTGAAAYASRELAYNISIKDVHNWRAENERINDPVVRGAPNKKRANAAHPADVPISMDSENANKAMMRRGSEMLAKRLAAYFVVKGYQITCLDSGVRVQ